jgi:hypothetical protein
VVVRYTAEGDTKTANEVDRVGAGTAIVVVYFSTSAFLHEDRKRNTSACHVPA